METNELNRHINDDLSLMRRMRFVTFLHFLVCEKKETLLEAATANIKDAFSKYLTPRSRSSEADEYVDEYINEVLIPYVYVVVFQIPLFALGRSSTVDEIFEALIWEFRKVEIKVLPNYLYPGTFHFSEELRWKFFLAVCQIAATICHIDPRVRKLHGLKKNLFGRWSTL